MVEEMGNRKNFNVEAGKNDDTLFDDDGRPKRTGTLLTASAHIITAVIGTGVLSLSWAIAQLGWIGGVVALIAFSLIGLYCSNLLADCYRYPDPITGKRNYTYGQVVKSNLGKIKRRLCSLSQYAILVGVSVGYTLTASISTAAIRRSHCFHKHGHAAGCHVSTNIDMIIFGIIQILLSQIPNFHELSILSFIAAVMSFAYSFIGIGLSAARVAERNHVITSITGVVVGVDVTKTEKIWNSLQALGNIAVAYSFSSVLVEIEDTLKSSPPENKVMKKATLIAVIVITAFYVACGTVGYAAFGNSAPGNFLTGFGFYEPFWLIDIGNLCIVIHLVGAYQVFTQPVYDAVESLCMERWPENGFITREYSVDIPKCGIYKLNLLRLVWRSIYVIATTLVAMIFPFFNSILGLLGALSFWPLTVYFPIEIYISHAKIRKYTLAWFLLKTLSFVCFIVSILAAVGSVAGLITNVKTFKPFHYAT